MHSLEPVTAPAASSRFDALDAARAGLLLAMAAYHAVWDLGFLRLTPENYALTPPGRLAAQAIAGGFLLLVGVGLVLMNRARLRWNPFARRLARIAAAALALTLATVLAFPESYIFFGILHCIAVSSVLALPFLFLPPVATALAAAVVAGLAWMAPLPGFEAPTLAFLGLGGHVPDTNDWVPLVPWFGLVLAGVALARLALPAFAASRAGRWRAQARAGRLAVRAGRHSLAIYLIHQPVLLGLLYGLASLTGPHPQAGVASFRTAFEENCARGGGGPGLCREAGRCMAEALRREGLWNLGRVLAPEQRARAQALARGCYDAAGEAGTAP